MSGLKEGKNQYESDDIAHGHRENTAAAIFSFPKNVRVWTGNAYPCSDAIHARAGSDAF